MSMQNISIRLYQREVDPQIKRKKHTFSAKTVSKAVELIVDELKLMDNEKLEMSMWSRWPVKINDKCYDMHIEVQYSQGSKG